MKIRKAVFPAAGLGTRFLPATKAQPKEMLPVVDKPIIQYAMEEAISAGVEQVVLVTGRGKHAIEDHFDVSFELERFLEDKGKKDLLRDVRLTSELASVSYVRQKQPLGLGHAILVARDLVGSEPFAVLLADDIIDSAEPCLAQMMKVHAERGGSVIAVMDVAESEVHQYGIVAGDDGSRVFRVTNLVEKPRAADAPSKVAIIGRYILSPRVFEILEKTTADGRGEIQITDAMRTLLADEPIWAYRFEGRRYDAGDKLGFLKATVELALKRGDLGARFREYLRGLQL
ncbi:MAG: UTP--glucose-1-phosphate uridylyltransferase GalU [Acidobacteriota bacterium]